MGKGQPLRDWIRQNITSKDGWRIGVAMFFTVVHDVAGLFSASRTLDRVPFFAEFWKKLFFVFGPIVFFDLSSEVMLLMYHDLPLVRRKPINTHLCKVALGGQIITSLMWLALAIWVVYDAIFQTCRANSVTDCVVNGTGLSETLVVLMVWFKNSMLLKTFKDRYQVYPIIVDESFLWLHHFRHKQSDDIIKDFKKANNIEERNDDDEDEVQEDEVELDDELENSKVTKTEKHFFDFMETREFLIGIDFAALVAGDLAALASVFNIIYDPEDPTWAVVLRALWFSLIILLDIASEAIILVVHDMRILVNRTVEFRGLFNLARGIQAFCTFSWICALGYMVFKSNVVLFTCKSTCRDCTFTNDVVCVDSLGCGSGTCLNSTCLFTESGACRLYSNDTIAEWRVPHQNLTFINTTFCKSTESRDQCLRRNPSMIDCVLLGLVLVDSIYSTTQIWFKSHIYPIVLPEATMFSIILGWRDKSSDQRHKLIIQAVGRMEFGVNWDVRELAKQQEEKESKAPEVGYESL